ncbi:hypothetical protein L3Y34_010560 [Caenorhabditis briggsae]|uniref:Uncharacterized protein n=1 Tax=Caenorhabditis briggsae TaxID=6238 RepID=A0AAE8ZQC5_CAEBR|nr:hypothetical protein L3Y34_010560 [Caenorhabditis briggsae]
MPFPTLSKLAAKAVAEGILNDTLSLDYALDTKSRNTIVQKLLDSDGDKYKILEVFKNKLNVTKIDFRRSMDCKIDAEGVRILSNFNLDSLDFGDLSQLIDKYPDNSSNNDTLDIVFLLMRALNNYSRRSLIHLGLPGDQEFIGGWEQEVSKIVPILQSMNISAAIFNERFQLSNLCISFPNLLVLDISLADSLSTLHGIKNLEKLQKLSMCFVDFDDSDGYKELSELKNLKYLDVSGSDFSIRDMLAVRVRMEALEFLDCSITSVTEYELEEFVKNHPSLRTIVAICTPCNTTTFSRIKVLNAPSLNSMSECLEYLFLTDRINMASNFMKDVFENLQSSPENVGVSELRQIKNAVIFVLRESVDPENNFWTAMWYLESGLFWYELSISLFSMEIFERINLFYNVFNANEMTEYQEEYVGLIFLMLGFLVNYMAPGILIPDRVLKFVIEKTVELVDEFQDYKPQGSQTISKAEKFMGRDQLQKIIGNSELMRKVQELLNIA